MLGTAQDKWAQWMLQRRCGGDPEQHKVVMEHLYPVRDRVLRNSGLSEGKVLLDVGAGDGLIAFGALELVRESGKVIFSDVSQDLLEHSRALAGEMGVLDRCEFVSALAESLPLGDGLVDAVTTRSVLIFVKEKQGAFEEFYRVLRPGGRISLHEPINSYFGGWCGPEHQFLGYDVTLVLGIVRKVREVFTRIQPPTDPMLDFDERDLLRMAESAGFTEVHMELQVNIKPGGWHTSWESLLRMSGNPLIPTLGEAMEQVLTPEEIEKLTQHMRPLVEAGEGVQRSAVCYLWAVK